MLTEGAAGGLSLTASYSVDSSDLADNPYIGKVSIDPSATLLGASLKSGEGGTLSLQSGSITVGTALQGTFGETLLSPHVL